MILLSQPLPCGNATRLLIKPASLRWRLLRRDLDPAFSGHDDPDALIVRENTADRLVVDDYMLANGQVVHYRLYSEVDGVWVGSAVATVVPDASYAELTWDALMVVRDRLEHGLGVEVERGALSHEQGAIPVLTAPPVYEDTLWPVVTVHLENEGPAERGLGEVIGAGEDLDMGLAEAAGGAEVEGWLARVSITVMGWSLNPDERVTLRKALRRIVLANLPVFDAQGMVQVEFSQQDAEDFQSYSAPVYQVRCTFSCLVPVAVSGRYERVQAVEVVRVDKPI